MFYDFSFDLPVQHGKMIDISNDQHLFVAVVKNREDYLREANSQLKDKDIYW